ncbi:unnamed protein product [Allacma fusca]|uniref:Uncharacterized protein n=1 Tax=Allacma fusca TaxID=39272 RepID=A0A8J2NRT2_9HEXA|nr:unnamed protein product [Allacma fusca]
MKAIVLLVLLVGITLVSSKSPYYNDLQNSDSDSEESSDIDYAGEKKPAGVEQRLFLNKIVAFIQRLVGINQSANGATTTTTTTRATSPTTTTTTTTKPV